MKKEREEIRKIIIQKYYCDICGDDAENSWGTPYICKICYRNICNKHLHREYEFGSDYADHYCKSCWDIGEKYREEKARIDEESERQMEEQDNKWHEEALKSLKK